MSKCFTSPKFPRRFGVAGLLLLMSLARFTSFAAGNKEEIPSISFDQFPYAIKRFYFFSYAGTPVSEAKEMNGPGPDDFPPHSMVFLEDPRRYPSLEKGPVYMMPARNVVRVYNISAVETAPYKTIQSHIKQLRELLKTRTTTAVGGEKLPDYPPRNAGHLVEAKMQYLDANWGRGLFYITQFFQSTREWPDNEQLVYLFQGLSKDEKFYVSADFRITHPSLDHAKPADDTETDVDELNAKLSSIMTKDPDEAFTPPLNKVREWVSSFKIE